MIAVVKTEDHGLSPRGRGNPEAKGRKLSFQRSIPAWAGEPLMTPSSPKSQTVYPRVGGGTTLGLGAYPGVTGLSPRGRGNRSPGYEPDGMLRSIPAWAGEPVAPCSHTCYHTVYPRVGGGTVNLCFNPLLSPGLSPRGRGNH